MCCKCNCFFCFLDLSKEKLCSILVFGTVRFTKAIWINHDNVASRGAVGRTHSIVRLQARIRRKDGLENFGGFAYVSDGFPQRDSVLWVLMCPNNITLFFDSIFASILCFSVSLLRLPRQGLPRSIYIARAIMPLPLTARLPRLCIYIPATTPQFRLPFLGYHT